MKRLRRAHQRDAREQAKKRKKFKQRAPLETQMKHSLMGRRKKSLTGRALAAGTAAVITLGAGASLNKALAQYIPDKHELPVSKDADWDFLADKEELAIGYRIFNPDQNRNEIPDGVELAKRCFTDVNNLPWEDERTDPNQKYKWWAPQFGVEHCDICAAVIVMGPGGVVNPRLGISVQFPFLMTLHYMEHGSFSYAARYGKEPVAGRIDVPALLRALELPLPYEPNDHKLPVTEDADTDLLADKEEAAIGYRIFKPDQNRNEIPDGVDLAMCCAAVIEQLPEFDFITPPGIKETHKIRYLTDGTESCEICGFTICMDHWDIVNPRLGMTVSLPVMAAHYMEHGSFSYAATYHNGRAHIAQLLRVLELRFPVYLNRHILPLDYVVEPVGQLASDANDLDGDLLADSEELEAGFDLHDPDQDQDLTPDGIELAKQCAIAINKLPAHDPVSGNPTPKQTYKIEHEVRGDEDCGVCGAPRNMGYVEIINPQLGLRIEIPFISIHYMEHGSLSYFGYYQYGGGLLHYGRLDISLLARILEMPRRCGDLGTIYLPGDLNEDCQVNFPDFAKIANKWLESTDPNQDGYDKQ